MKYDKGRLRAIKRQLKRSGNKKARREVKRNLIDGNEIEPFTYGGLSTKVLNGMDNDTTRQRD